MRDPLINEYGALGEVGREISRQFSNLISSTVGSLITQGYNQYEIKGILMSELEYNISVFTLTRAMDLRKSKGERTCPYFLN